MTDTFKSAVRSFIGVKNYPK